MGPADADSQTSSTAGFSLRDLKTGLISADKPSQNFYIITNYLRINLTEINEQTLYIL